MAHVCVPMTSQPLGRDSPWFGPNVGMCAADVKSVTSLAAPAAGHGGGRLPEAARDGAPALRPC